MGAAEKEALVIPANKNKIKISLPAGWQVLEILQWEMLFFGG